MKKLLLPLFVLFAGCASTTPVGVGLEDSYLLQVNCVKDAGTRREVMMLLRQCKAKDVHEEEMGGELIIEAAYYKSDNSLDQLDQIADNLRAMGTVIDVLIRDNPHVVRQGR